MGIHVNLDLMLVRRKMKLTDLAERVDITAANLSVLKQGRARAIRFSTLDAICRELACQPADILEYRPDIPAPGGTIAPAGSESSDGEDWVRRSL